MKDEKQEQKRKQTQQVVEAATMLMEAAQAAQAVAETYKARSGACHQDEHAETVRAIMGRLGDRMIPIMGDMQQAMVALQLDCRCDPSAEEYAGPLEQPRQQSQPQPQQRGGKQMSNVQTPENLEAYRKAQRKRPRDSQVDLGTE